MSHDTVVDEVVDGKYQLLGEIARGTQGIVYEARTLRTGQVVALKRLRPEYSSSPKVARRFIREATIMSRFAHPNIAQVLDAGQDPANGALYMVQPLLPGTDMREALHGYGRLRPREALDLLVPIMAALIATHHAGVVHRDLKPGNILLVRDPGRGLRPVLIDFGIAKLLDDDPSQRTATGALLGTPLYMSPEQASGDSSLDARSDVWAIGVILFEMVSGATPFAAPTVGEILARVVSQPAPRLDTVAPGVSREFADIVARALTIPKEQRFQSMAEFLEALLKCPKLDANTEGHDLVVRHHAALTAKVPLDEMTTTEVLPTTGVARPIAPTQVTQWVPQRLVERVRPAAAEAAPSSPRRSRLGSVRLIAAGVLLGAALTVAALRPRSGTYTVSVTAHPSSATLELDGEPGGTGHIERVLPRDGRMHVLRIRAAGYVTREVTFRDEPPPANQQLSAESAALP